MQHIQTERNKIKLRWQLEKEALKHLGPYINPRLFKYLLNFYLKM